MSRNLATGLGLSLLTGAAVLLAGCGDDAAKTPKTALNNPVEQAPQQVAKPVPSVQPVAPAASVAIPPVAKSADIKAGPKVPPRVVKAAPIEPRPVEKVVSQKPAPTIRAAAAPKEELTAPHVAQPPVRMELPKPAQTQMQVVTQVHIRPGQLESQPTAPMPWLKPSEFKGVNMAANTTALPPPVAERTMGYEPRPNPYANAYVPQEAPQVALQQPGFNFTGMGPISYDPNHRLADFLPTIKKVQPTGEKPLVVISFKCPTEGLGIATPTTKILHGVVDTALGGINATNVLPWNLQQVCS